MVIPRFVNSAVNNRKIEIYGNGNQNQNKKKLSYSCPSTDFLGISRLLLLRTQSFEKL